MSYVKITTPDLALIVTHEVLQAISAYAQHQSDQPERGGVLVGHFPDTWQTLNITKFTHPQANDYGSRFHFHREAEPHMTLLHEMWESSGHTLNYVGEWHTHPEEVPTYSSTDLSFWREATRDFTYPGEGLVFIIVGTQKIRGWYMLRGADLPDLILEVPVWKQIPIETPEERKAKAITQILGLVEEIQEGQKQISVAFPDHETSKLPLGLALGLAGAGIPMPPQRSMPHLSTDLNVRDYQQLKQALDASAAPLGYPLGVTDGVAQDFARRWGMASKFTAPSVSQTPTPAPKTKFKKPRHPNARKGRR